VAVGALAALIPGPAAQASSVGECQAVSANQVAVTQCLQTTLSSADQVMGTALERLLKRADELDGVTGRVVARPAVEQSQVEWQAFRDANCAVPAALSGGASGSGQFQLGCMITMSRARANELDELAAGIY
jgi:uncharacterized protein YecT (DUF1311 family)